MSDFGGRVRSCGYWHANGAVEHNAANCWKRPCTCDKPAHPRHGNTRR